MINLRKAAEIAIAALIEARSSMFDGTKQDKAINALRAALAEPEPTRKPASQVPNHKPTGWVTPKNQYAVPVLFNPYTGEPRDVRDVQSDPQGVLIVPPGKVEMVAALAEPEQEPVAWVDGRWYEDGTRAGNTLVWAGRRAEDDFPVGTNLYTRPATPLTDEQIDALKRAWQTAMYRTGSTRIPECRWFGEIAQDLDFVLCEIGVKK